MDNANLDSKTLATIVNHQPVKFSDLLAQMRHAVRPETIGNRDLDGSLQRLRRKKKIAFEKGRWHAA